MHSPGERQTLAVQLVAGRDYALSGWVATPDAFDSEFHLRIEAAGGRSLCGEFPSATDAFAEAEHVGGCTFRAPYTGGYTIVLTGSTVAGQQFAYDYLLWLRGDCRAARGTQCAISVNHSHQQLVDYDGDDDWFATRLVGGYTYRIAAVDQLGNGWVDLTLRSPTGAVIATAEPDTGPSGTTATLTVRAPASGAYFVDVGDASGQEARFGYTLSLARVR